MYFNKIINLFFIYFCLGTFIFSVFFLFKMLFSHSKKNYKTNSYIKVISVAIISLLLFFLPEITRYQEMNVYSETIKYFSEIDITKLYKYASANSENFDELTNSFCYEVDGTYVDINFYKKSFQEIKDNPLEDLVFREKLFCEFKKYENTLVIINPIKRIIDVDTMPINKYALNRVFVYTCDGKISISYHTEKKDADLMLRIAQILKDKGDSLFSVEE